MLNWKSITTVFDDIMLEEAHIKRRLERPGLTQCTFLFASRPLQNTSASLVDVKVGMTDDLSCGDEKGRVVEVCTQPPKILKTPQRKAKKRTITMYASTVISVFLVALAAAAPYRNGQADADAEPKRGLVAFIMTEPDCPAIKAYCTHCNGDFNCETDPRCEWCYENHQFGN
ncbi:hypothetical protein CIB48_g6460 [Xylaria polymorpha]|nr:hypothetical protein CIB48_g6460 [Xylaria polymorpha]